MTGRFTPKQVADFLVAADMVAFLSRLQLQRHIDVDAPRRSSAIPEDVLAVLAYWEPLVHRLDRDPDDAEAWRDLERWATKLLEWRRTSQL